MLGSLHVFIQSLRTLLQVNDGLINIPGNGCILNQTAKRSVATVNFSHDFSKFLGNYFCIFSRNLQS